MQVCLLGLTNSINKLVSAETCWRTRTEMPSPRDNMDQPCRGSSTAGALTTAASPCREPFQVVLIGLHSCGRWCAEEFELRVAGKLSVQETTRLTHRYGWFFLSIACQPGLTIFSPLLILFGIAIAPRSYVGVTYDAQRHFVASVLPRRRYCVEALSV